MLAGPVAITLTVLPIGWKAVVFDISKHDPNSGSFCSMVGRKLVLPRGLQWRDVWGRVVAPTIAKKYVDMRNNINNLIRVEYMGNYYCASLLVMSIL